MNFSITHPPGSWSWEQVKKIKNENWIFICKQILFLNFVCAWFWWHCLHACFCCHLKGLLFLSITVDDDSLQTAFLHPTVSYMKNLDWANLKQQLSIFIYKALLQRLPADLRSLIEFKHSTYLVRSRDILTSPFCWFHTELGKNLCKILCCLDMKQA